MEWLIFVGIVALIGYAAWNRYHSKHRRIRELQDMARQLGLEYWGDDIEGLVTHPFPLFRQGDRQGIENVVRGEWKGIPVRGFDYWYYKEVTDAEGRKRRSSRQYFSCAMGWIDAYCPSLTVVREGPSSRMAHSLGMHDIQFELGEFNNAFNVSAGDRKFAFDFIDARMMRWLLSASTEFRFEVAGNKVLVFSRRRRAFEMIPLLGTVKGFCDQVPRVIGSLYPPLPGSIADGLSFGPGSGVLDE